MSMAAIERVLPIVGHLPPSIRDALGRRLRELTGLGLIGLSGAAAAALMTWGVRWNLNRAPGPRYRLVNRRLRFTRTASVMDAMAAMMRVPDVEDKLLVSGIPMLVATGHGDLWTTARHRAFAQRIGAQVRVYGTGHSPMETVPREMAADLVAFLAEADRAGQQ